MKQRTFSVGIALVVLILAACASHRTLQPVQPFQQFDAFIAEVQQAKSGDYVGRPGYAVESAAAFDEMKQYVLTMYTGVHPANSFIGPDRQILDCVPLRQQPSLKGAAASADVPNLDALPQKTGSDGDPQLFQRQRSEDITLRPGVRDRLGNEIFCQSGTIPMRRITILEVASFSNLRSFLAKSEGEKDPDLPADDSSHYYARGGQFVDNLGGDSWLNVWSPTVSEHRMSLSQQWFVSGEGEQKQTIESGWQVYPDKYKTNVAALFIYYTTKGYASGSGCYNLECSGFVQIASNIYLGRGFTNYSSIDGGQWGFNLQWQRHTDNNWWLLYRGPGNYIAVGYYPASLFGENGLLRNNARKIAFGGEDSGKPTALQMGSGRKAAEGWRRVAYQNRIFYIDTNRISQWAKLDEYESNPDCYTADIHNIDGSWGRYLYFGRPS